MPQFRCPGQTSSSARLESFIVPCPSCDGEVEVFGDEQKVRCRCGQWVFREALPTCAKWCSAAAQCLGQVGNFAELLQDVQNSPDQKEQERRLKALREQIDEAQAQCSLPKFQQEQGG